VALGMQMTHQPVPGRLSDRKMTACHSPWYSIDIAPTFFPILMLLSLEQAAERLGKTTRQVRYLIKQGRLPAQKQAGRWMIDADDLPLSDPQKAAVDRRERALRDAVEEGLGLNQEPPARYSVRNMKSFQIALPLFQNVSAALGAEHAAAVAMREVLLLLTRGCHRFDREDKAAAYRTARDAASLAVCELILSGQEAAEPLVHEIEQNLMAALSGLLRRMERRGRR
jgi:hypothetical protein